jgi:hypothetical protein
VQKFKWQKFWKDQPRNFDAMSNRSPAVREAARYLITAAYFHLQVKRLALHGN